MAGIPVEKISEAIFYPSVPWAKKKLSLKKRSFEKFKTPEHLKPFLFEKNSIPKECATKTASLKGTERIMAMNSCVREMKGKIPEKTIPLE